MEVRFFVVVCFGFFFFCIYLDVEDELRRLTKVTTMLQLSLTEFGSLNIYIVWSDLLAARYLQIKVTWEGPTQLAHRPKVCLLRS